MTKYLEKSFNSPANSKAYVDNWERTFGKKEERKLVAEGYCHHLAEEHAVVVMKVVGEEEEQHYEVGLDKLSPDTVAGSFLKLYDDGNIELFAPKWTAEELEEIKKDAAKYDEFFDLGDDDE